MRKFLVVMDDSTEFLNALYFASLRANNSGGGVVILSVVEPDANTWLGVRDAMERETQENIEAHFKVFEKWMSGKVDIQPELVVRNGRKSEEILNLIAEDREIGVLVLGAGQDRKGPGPLIQDLVSKRGGQMPIPVTIVPAGMSREEIEAVT